jgi:hypothetical protein
LGIAGWDSLIILFLYEILKSIEGLKKTLGKEDEQKA